MWEPDPPEGRPRRHLYRLTAAGAALAAVSALLILNVPALIAAYGGSRFARHFIRRRHA